MQRCLLRTSNSVCAPNQSVYLLDKTINANSPNNKMKQTLLPAISALFVSLFLCPLFCWGATPDKPNIIYILADDLGYGDLSCYGQQRFQTPNLDRLASEGIRFTDHYAGCTVCAPSRASLMTGQHVGHCLVRGNYETGPHGFGGELPLRPNDVTIAETLQQAGYRTGLFGKWGMGMDGTTGEPNKKGFDYAYGFLNQAHAHHYYPEYVFRNGKKEPIPENASGEHNVYLPDRVTEESLEFIDRNRDRPFFMFLALITPHAELLVPDDSLQEFSGRWPETPFEKNGSGGDGFSDTFGAYASQPMPRAAYAAMITRMDRDIGRLLAKLKETGLDKNTIVMFSSDNGPHLEGGADPDFFDSSGGLSGRKRDLYEGGIRVPLVARWPENIKAGTTSNYPSAFWDILPTCADLAGAPHPEATDGVSLLPTLLGKAQQEQDRFLYWEFHERGFTEQAVRQGRWKVVRHGPLQPLELYDLESDVAEQTNLASSKPGIVAKFEKYLQTARTSSEIWPLADRKSKRAPVGGRKASANK